MQQRPFQALVTDTSSKRIKSSEISFFANNSRKSKLEDEFFCIKLDLMMAMEVLYLNFRTISLKGRKAAISSDIFNHSNI